MLLSTPVLAKAYKTNKSPPGAATEQDIYYVGNTGDG